LTDLHAAPRDPVDALPTSWQRLLALSGIAFAVFLLVAWFSNGAETPHYTAPDHEWTTWAHNTEMKGRIAAFFALLAGLVFIPFAATIREVLARSERSHHGSLRLSQIAYAGGLIGMTSFTIATVTFSGASAEGAQAHADVSRAIATGDVGPFLVAPVGFAVLLAAGGLATMRTGILPRWTGVVAFIGAVGFSITFLTTLDGTADGSVFGYGFFPGVVALVTWSIATSVARYRSLRPAGDVSTSIEAART
jgi:succinate dehydrogenase/fumarate reductase cytochrome b subunit